MPSHLAAVHPTQMAEDRTAPPDLAVEKKIGGDVQGLDQSKVLVDRFDAECLSMARIVYVDHLAIEEDLAAVRPDGSRQALHEGRLTGAVVAK